MLPARVSQAPNLATASTLLVARGIPVFPCVPGAKQPLTAHGFHDATTDVATVQQWWRRWPDANIGMPTGAVSGVDVVDVDVHPGGSGFEAFEQARSAGLAHGWAWVVRTPSGGFHACYLRGTASEQRSWQSPARHIDFRGDGGYVVVPPSRVLDAEGQVGAYRLIAVTQLPISSIDAGALRTFLEPPRPAPPRPGASQHLTRPEHLAAHVARLQEGERNHGLFWAACRMVEQGHPFETTADVLGDPARTIGLEDREIMTTIRSAYRRTTALPPATPTATSRRTEAVSL